jgi:hypothetical protein
MKAATTLLILLFSGCVTSQAPEPTDQAPEAASPGPAPTSQAVGTGDAFVTTTYHPNKYDDQDIWPTGQAIQSMQVIFKRGPVRSDGPSYLAFIVWNGNTVGKIFCVHVGAEGADLRKLISDTTATRTINVSVATASTTGSGGAGPIVPTPHPNVDVELQFSPTYLSNIKMHAQALLSTTTNAMMYPELPTPL